MANIIFPLITVLGGILVLISLFWLRYKYHLDDRETTRPLILLVTGAVVTVASFIACLIFCQPI